MVVSDQAAQEEKPGFFKRITSKLTETKAAREFRESEQYKKLEEMRAEMKEFKTNLKEELDNT